MFALFWRSLISSGVDSQLWYGMRFTGCVNGKKRLLYDKEGDSEKVHAYDNNPQRAMIAASTWFWYAEESGTAPLHCSY